MHPRRQVISQIPIQFSTPIPYPSTHTRQIGVPNWPFFNLHPVKYLEHDPKLAGLEAPESSTTDDALAKEGSEKKKK